MKDVDICMGVYASHWDLIDFYPQSEAALKAALASGEDFTTGWFGCKKEIRYARIQRDSAMGDECGIIVDVAACMDDFYEGDDLIYDAYWEVTGLEEELPEEVIQNIRDIAGECGVDDRAEETEYLPLSASYEDIIGAMARLESVTEMKNKENYARLCEIVKEIIGWEEP